MNTVATLTLSALAASATAFGITYALQPEPAPDPSLPMRALEATVEELRTSNQQLQQRLEELANRPQRAAVPASVERAEVPSLSDEAVAAAVEAYLRRRVEGAGSGEDGEALPFDLEKDLKSLLGNSYWDNTAAWKRAFEAGKMDEVIAEFEALAKANPNDIPAQMDLANAYMAYLQMDNSKWQLSMKADQQFDKVLDIDETHWEARFTKAMSYTFWPEFLGKKNDAISHFETLVKQQESMPAEQHHAQTYLFLGNMLAERDPARAREVWQKGMTRHPNSAELREKLAK